MKKNNASKEQILYYLVDCIALLDNTWLSTTMVDKAIERLKDIKHVRENMPF